MGIIAIEFGFRLFAPTIYTPRRIEPGVPFVTLPNGHLEYMPDTTFASIYDPAGDERGYFGTNGRIEYRINKFGFRGPALARRKSPGTLRIACLGDSFTFGEGVRYEDTWPAVLGVRLDSAPPTGYKHAETINAGVQGYGLSNCLLAFGLRVEPFNPDIVVLAVFMNDLMDTGETIRLNDDAQRNIELTGIARYSAIAAFFERRNAATARQQTFFNAVRASFDETGRTTLRESLNGMEAYSHERGFRLVVVVWPVLWGLDGAYPFADLHSFISKSCDQSGIDCVDLLDTFRGKPAASLWVHPTDQHPNEIAHRMAAEAIAEHLEH